MPPIGVRPLPLRHECPAFTGHSLSRLRNQDNPPSQENVVQQIVQFFASIWVKQGFLALSNENYTLSKAQTFYTP